MTLEEPSLNHKQNHNKLDPKHGIVAIRGVVQHIDSKHGNLMYAYTIV